MKTRWILPLTAVALFTVATGTFSQTAAAPEPGQPPSLTSPPAPPTPPAPGVGVALSSDQTPPPPPQPPEAPRGPKVVQQPRGTAPMPGSDPGRVRRPSSQLVNVRLEFTITDQTGAKPPARKTVMMLVADGESGRIRTNNDLTTLFKANYQRASLPLNIDAAPEVEGNKIRLRVSLDLQSQDDPATPDLPAGSSRAQQSVSSIVTDGVATILSQSADPVTDRKVTLEVKATILR